jgi:hypothetical protein
MEQILETFSRYSQVDPDLATALTARELNVDEAVVRFALAL